VRPVVGFPADKAVVAVQKRRLKEKLKAKNARKQGI